MYLTPIGPFAVPGTGVAWTAWIVGIVTVLTAGSVLMTRSGSRQAI